MAAEKPEGGCSKVTLAIVGLVGTITAACITAIVGPIALKLIEKEYATPAPIVITAIPPVGNGGSVIQVPPTTNPLPQAVNPTAVPLQALPSNGCPNQPGAGWLQLPYQYYGPFPDNTFIGFETTGAIHVYNPITVNVMDFYFDLNTSPRSQWINLTGTRYSICVTNDANSFVYAIWK